ncbi:3'-5' DNA helicase [Linnemannia elongata]|nr:3'-5' DNA helicase [Linnemannia elongata]
MAPSMDDDFDFGDLADLDLDDDEKAMLANDYKSQRFQHQHQPSVNNTWNQTTTASSSNNNKQNTFFPSNSNNTTPTFNNNNSNNNNRAQQQLQQRDEFEDFGDLDDAAFLLDDKDLMDEDNPAPSTSSSSSSVPVRSNFFSGNNIRPPQQQLQQQRQGQGQQFFNKATPPPQVQTKPAQPAKLFSIFGGATNQPNPINNNNNNANGFNTNNIQGGLARTGSGLMAANGNNNASPYFNANNNNNNGFATLRKTNTSNNRNNTAIIPRSDPNNDFAEDIYKSPEIPVQPAQRPTHHTIDDRAILTWQYPINYPKRDYQYNIIRRALFTNTLVSLPTGLGKTFIAAVVMLNYFRWFPKSKIVFMAPTRPLVNQQIEACFNICGIPQEATVELTGQSNPALRQQVWKDKRVFFCTPQILNNDLKSGLCPAKDLVCLVVDEAHRATGNYAYSQVVRELEPINRDVRILALSATPGSDIRAVQKVVTNLKIAKIESRTEDSMDLQAYVFKRNITEIVVPCGRDISEIRDKFVRMMRPYLERLMKSGVIRTADPAQLSRFVILQGKNGYIQENRGNTFTKNLIVRTSLICMSLVAAYELLVVYGIWPFFVNMDPHSSRDAAAERDEQEATGRGRGSTGSKKNKNNQDDDEDDEIKMSLARKAMEENPEFMRMMDQIRLKVKQPTFVSHPKIERLVAIVIKHFMDHQDKTDASRSSSSTSSAGDRATPAQTRIMIFANFRESVDEISRALEKHRPLIKVRQFIGQATAKGKKGISQKEQQKVVADFQKGEYNVLVATSIGEEGLDIGDVDLIVCYDSHSSPIRMLQRMGRTGRKRAGKICLLLAEGQEEGKYRKSQSTYKAVQKAITQGNQIVYYPENPKIIPAGPLPTCDLLNINVPTYVNPALAKKRKRLENEIPAQTNRLRGAYLEPDELAQFQQRYRLPKKQIRKITFRSACNTMLRNKKSTMVPDKTFVVGHSTRTLEYIKNVNRMAKARVEQSLNSASRSLTSDEPDLYTKRMLALLEKSKTLDQDMYQDQDDDGTGRSRSAMKSFLSRNKNFDAYSYDSLDDDEMEDLGQRIGSAKGSSLPGRRRRVILSDSELEDHTTTDDDIGRSKTGGDHGRPKVMPKPRRKQTTAAQKKDSRNEGGVVPKPGSKAKPTATAPQVSIKSFFHTVSDDEVDREIMGGLDNMFGFQDDQQYSRGPTMSPSPYEDDDPLPTHESRARPQKGFDFQESATLPALWYRAPASEDDGSELGQDDLDGEEADEVSLVLQPAMAFVVFDIPPVPNAGQWYQPDQEAPTFTDNYQDDLLPRAPQSTTKATGSLKTAKAPPSPQEVVLIESSDDDVWRSQAVEGDARERYEVPGGSKSRNQDTSRVSNGHQGFVSARTLSSTRFGEADKGSPSGSQGRKAQRSSFGHGQEQTPRRSQGRTQDQGSVQSQRRQAEVGQSRTAVKRGQLWGDPSSSSNNEFEFGDDDEILPDLDDYELWD